MKTAEQWLSSDSINEAVPRDMEGVTMRDVYMNIIHMAQREGFKAGQIEMRLSAAHAIKLMMSRVKDKQWAFDSIMKLSIQDEPHE